MSILGLVEVWFWQYAVVNFISDQFASLPCQVFKVAPKGGGVVPADDDSALKRVMTGVVNDNWLTSGGFRKAAAISVLLNGRAFAYLEITNANAIKNIRPLEYERVEPRIRQGKLEYVETRLDGSKIVHPAERILDINPQPKMDGVSHYSPVYLNRATLRQMLMVERFSAGVFKNNGVPPLQLVSVVPQSGGATQRAGDVVMDALKVAAAQGKNILPLPTGYELKKIGFDPASLQLLDLKKWQVEETARIWRLPKFFLGLTDGGTLANVEHQAQSLIRNTLMPMLIAPFEAEVSAKLGKRNEFVKLNLNGFVRGDFKTQMEGLRTAVHGAIYTPNEARGYLELGPVDGGDDLFIQGATVPIKMAGEKPEPDATFVADPVAEPVAEEPGE